jgi:hypothetical protein
VTATVSVARDGEDHLLAVVHRDGEESDVEFVGADLYALKEQFDLLGEDAEQVEWVLPEGLRLELTDADRGRFVVSTWHTTRFMLDLDADPVTITRIPGPQLDEAGQSVVNVHADDGVAARVMEVRRCRVGKSAVILREYPWARVYGDVYVSTRVRHIEAADSGMWVLEGGEVMTGVHPADLCAGRPCVIHHPSDHPLRGLPLHWREDRGFFERRCEHGEGPDPDDVAYHSREGRRWVAAHGCDGCCGSHAPADEEVCFDGPVTDPHDE